MLILLIWTVATAFAISFAAWKAFGPVVLVLTRSHGVHFGDLVAAAGAFGGAALLTNRLARVPDRSSAAPD